MSNTLTLKSKINKSNSSAIVTKKQKKGSYYYKGSVTETDIHISREVSIEKGVLIYLDFNVPVEKQLPDLLTCLAIEYLDKGDGIEKIISINKTRHKLNQTEEDLSELIEKSFIDPEEKDSEKKFLITPIISENKLKVVLENNQEFLNLTNNDIEVILKLNR